MKSKYFILFSIILCAIVSQDIYAQSSNPIVNLLVGKWLPNNCNAQTASINDGIFYEFNNKALSQKVVLNNQVIQQVFILEISQPDPNKNEFRLAGVEIDPISKRSSTYISVRKFGNSVFEVVELDSDGKKRVSNSIDLETNKPYPLFVKCSSSTKAGSVSIDREQAWKNLYNSNIKEILALDHKSQQFAARSKTQWRSFQSSDQMSGKSSLIVRNQAPVGTGRYTADLTCNSDKKSIAVEINLQGVTSPTSTREFRDGRWASGRLRNNEQVKNYDFFQHPNFSNVFIAFVGHIFDGRFVNFSEYGFTKNGTWDDIDSDIKNRQNFEDCQGKIGYDCSTSEIKKRTAPNGARYDIALELTTSGGPIYFEIPSANAEIKKLIDSCR
jgi:hypothetical protein